MTTPVIDPKQDGLGHINCWTKGRTSLGRELSNLSYRPFKHPVHGSFASVEAFWYWLGSGKTANHLRPLFGHSAKSAGSLLKKVEIDQEEFRKEICTAIRCKIEQHADLRQEFVKSELPFLHYFVYGLTAVRPRTNHNWQMEYLEQLRDELRSEKI